MYTIRAVPDLQMELEDELFAAQAEFEKKALETVLPHHGGGGGVPPAGGAPAAPAARAAALATGATKEVATMLAQVRPYLHI